MNTHLLPYPLLSLLLAYLWLLLSREANMYCSLNNAELWSCITSKADWVSLQSSAVPPNQTRDGKKNINLQTFSIASLKKRLRETRVQVGRKARITLRQNQTRTLRGAPAIDCGADGRERVHALEYGIHITSCPHVAQPNKWVILCPTFLKTSHQEWAKL